MTDVEDLRWKLDRARVRLASAMTAKENAERLTEAAREMGGGIPGFGGSGNQRAARQVKGALDREYRAHKEADERIEHWTYKVRSLERRIAESERIRFTAEDLTAATHVKDSTSWRKVIRVSAKSVTVETPYSWNDRIPIEQIREFRIIPDGVSSVW